MDGRMGVVHLGSVGRRNCIVSALPGVVWWLNAQVL